MRLLLLVLLLACNPVADSGANTHCTTSLDNVSAAIPVVYYPFHGGGWSCTIRMGVEQDTSKLPVGKYVVATIGMTPLLSPQKGDIIISPTTTYMVVESLCAYGSCDLTLQIRSYR